MALHFVSTSILSSENGIDFGKEEIIISEESKKAIAAAERASNRPLYEQLFDQQQKKQEEYDANTKRMFAPPKALDEDEVEYFNNLKVKRNEALSNRHSIEEKALEVFRTMQRDSSSSNQTTSINFSLPEPKKEIIAKLPVIAKKRKAAAVNGNDDMSANPLIKSSKGVEVEVRHDNEDINIRIPDKNNIIEKSTSAQQQEQKGEDSIPSSGLIFDYGSDSE